MCRRRLKFFDREINFGFCLIDLERGCRGQSSDMNEQKFNSQMMTEYLLGSLPEAEMERFDELSFTDNEFADNLQTAEKDLVDAYASGELTGLPLEKFKSHYLASPLRRGKVKFAQAFQVFAEKNAMAQPAATREEISAALELLPKPVRTGFFSGFFAASRPSLQWATAFAALLFMLIGGWLFFENSRLHNQLSETQAKRDELWQRERELQKQIDEQRSTGSETKNELARVGEERERLEQELEKEKAQQQQQRVAEQKRERLAEQRAAGQRQSSMPRPPSIVTFILAPQLRGGNQIQTLSIPAQTDSVKIGLELESGDYQSYRVALRNQSDNKIIWRSGAIKAKTSGANKRLNVNFPARLLRSQIYSLEVSGVAADGTVEIISDYPFRVVR